jgi:hypothetical protein
MARLTMWLARQSSRAGNHRLGRSAMYWRAKQRELETEAVRAEVRMRAGVSI